jgi:hypothetical protein
VLRRVFWLFLGMGVGMGSSLYITRRVKQVAARYAPERISSDMADSVRALGRDVRLSLQDGREAMRQREAQLRAEDANPAFTEPTR